MSFVTLQERINTLQNPTVVGLDPDLQHIPPQILEKHIAELGENLDAAARAVIEFNMNLIEALHDIVPAVKPQAAYYEILGAHGIQALKLTCDYARSKGMYVIIDAKRGDIGSVAETYSEAYLGTIKVGSAEYAPFNADALTVNTYLGSDGIKPFIDTAKKHDKAIFALVKTSNPSSGEIQDKMVNKPPIHLYQAVGEMLEDISDDTIDKNGYTCAGAVVGATYPEELSRLRKKLKHTFFLVPGYGAQGGTAENVKGAFDENGNGAIINSSRGIIAAWKKENAHYADAARKEALSMRDELRKVLDL